MQTKTIARVEGLRGDMQVTLEFEVGPETKVNRVFLKTMVSRHLLPLIDEGLMHGEFTFLGVPYEWVSSGGDIDHASTIDLKVVWTAHRPWWADDNPDWDKVPFEKRSFPDPTHIT